MITGFENITHELTEFEESVLLPLIVGKLCFHKGKSNAISATKLQAYAVDRGIKQNVCGSRIRKIIEHIRQKNLLEGLIANSNGYYVAERPEELNDWITSMKQRINAMEISLSQIERVYRNMPGQYQS